MNGFVSEHKHKIVLRNWPKSFGDVMPLETVWKKMGDEFSRSNIKATDDDSLWRKLLQCGTLCANFIIELIQDVPSKLQKIEQSGAMYSTLINNTSLAAFFFNYYFCVNKQLSRRNLIYCDIYFKVKVIDSLFHCL